MINFFYRKCRDVYLSNSSLVCNPDNGHPPECANRLTHSMTVWSEPHRAQVKGVSCCLLKLNNKKTGWVCVSLRLTVQWWLNCQRSDKRLPCLSYDCRAKCVNTLEEERRLLNHWEKRSQNKTENAKGKQKSEDRLGSSCQRGKKIKRERLSFPGCVSDLTWETLGRWGQPTNMRPCWDPFWCDQHNLVDSCSVGSKGRTASHCIGLWR